MFHPPTGSTRRNATLQKLSALGVGVFVGTSCVGGGAHEDGDEEQASFGGADAKNDDQYSSCELREALAFLNRSTTTEESLRDATFAGLRTARQAAANLVSHRNGADRTLGTADDDLFDDLNEVDAVAYVGPRALERLLDTVAPSCEVDLSSRPFIDATTFAGATGGGWSRDSTELEATFTASGVSGAALRAALLTETNGNTTFERIAENDALGAFTYDFPLDEIPWDADTAEIREQLPFIALTIEADRFPADPTTGEREVALGTDINDDIYFDTQQFHLLHRSLILRGRARWDDPTTIRRILIGAKAGSRVDDNGIKRADKIDVRNDAASPVHIASLETDVMRGRTSWGGFDQPAEPVRVVYEALRQANVLPDLQGHEDVLVLHPLAYLRSTRMRLHLNEARLENMRAVHAQGATRMREWVSAAEARLGTGAVSADERTALESFLAVARPVLDGTLLLARVNMALSAEGLAPYASVAELDAARAFTGAASMEEASRHRVLAAQIDAAYHDVSEQLDLVDRMLTGTSDDASDVFAEQFVAWVRSHDAALGRKTIMEPYLAYFDAVRADPARREAFNAFGAAQRSAGEDEFENFVAHDEASFTAMRGYLDLERNKIHQRQIALAGTMANALFFDEARELYVPDSERAWGNFIIDTTDFTDMVSHPEWHAMTDEERRTDRALPAARVFHSTLVNEVQIELGAEADYVDRIRLLTEAIATGTADADDARRLEGARFVFDTYQAALRTIAELKEERVLRQLRRAGVRDASWAPAARSKGETAISILADED